MSGARPGTRRRLGEVRSEKLSELIARQVLHDIGDQQLPPGAQLPAESAMCERFNVGKASVREAMRILEINGLISIRTGSGGGPVVGSTDGRGYGSMSTLHFQSLGATLRDLLNARVTLEPTLAAQAAARPGPEAGAALRGFLGSSLQAGSGTEHSDFHAVLCAAGGNPILALTARALRDIWAVRMEAVMLPEDRREGVGLDRRRITEAVENHDAGEAERLMREHLESYRDYCEQNCQQVLGDVVEWW
ncbi:FadR/GntR family transcriptional regulator [Nocardia sp. BMG51109]|uniref:FadR/GntR family transcriptional regulator n=1 Tax=Nocardia sp. BMG51109 TaxID=1056816 RepID=UPI0004643322|nr:FCD domain-containing protein [Nocardia sp. BMG51109]